MGDGPHCRRLVVLDFGEGAAVRHSSTRPSRIRIGHRDQDRRRGAGGHARDWRAPVADLVYTAVAPLDGFVADEDGRQQYDPSIVDKIA